jgi:hypothetical protein
MNVEFNTTPIETHDAMPIDADSVVNTSGLFNASMEDAARYGSEAINQVIEQMSYLFKGDRKYITVDAKVHMLFPKMSPAIPGWHTDGIPRMYEPGKYSVHKGVPDWTKQKSGDWRPHRYWLYNSGVGAPTRFLDSPLTLDVSNHDTSVYGDVNEKVEALQPSYTSTEPNKIYKFDWYNLHTAIPSTKREWRLLVRVVESDYFQPQEDADKIIRYQHQVYIQKGFGW